MGADGKSKAGFIMDARGKQAFCQYLQGWLWFLVRYCMSLIDFITTTLNRSIICAVIIFPLYTFFYSLCYARNGGNVSTCFVTKYVTAMFSHSIQVFFHSPWWKSVITLSRGFVVGMVLLMCTTENQKITLPFFNLFHVVFSLFAPSQSLQTSGKACHQQCSPWLHMFKVYYIRSCCRCGSTP